MKKILFALFTLNSLNVNAQDFEIRSIPKIDIGLGGIGFGYEAKIGKQLTLDLNTGVSGRYEIYNNSFKYIFANSFNALPAIYVSASPRYYYNHQKRLARGKNVANNSANYIGIKLKVVPHLKLPNPGALLNVHWGLQRSFGKNLKWLFNTHAGMGYGGNIGFGGSKGMLYPSIDFKWSYVLSKK